MADKDNVKETSKKSGFLKSFFGGVKNEFKKIMWPSKDSVVKKSAVVIVVTTIVAIIIAMVDYLAKMGLDKLL